MKIHRFFDFRRQGAPFASQFLFDFYTSGRPLISDLVEASINGKMSDFFPRGSAKGGALLFSPCYRGICPSDIKHAFLFQKCPRGSAIFFVFFFKKDTHPSILDFFLRQKRKSPRGSANPGRKKGRRLHGQFGLETVDPAVHSRGARMCPTVRSSPTPLGADSSRAGPEEGTRS